jgi:hypothetical protein
MCYKKSTFLAKFYQITILNTVLLFLELAAMATYLAELNPKTDPRKTIKVGDKEFQLKDGKFLAEDFPESFSKFGKKAGTFTPAVSTKTHRVLTDYQKDKIETTNKPNYLESIIKAVQNIVTGVSTNYYDKDTKQTIPLKVDNASDIGLSPNTLKKLLYIAEVAGLEGLPVSDIGTRAIGIPLTQDEKEFRARPRIEKWLKQYPADKKNSNALHTLYKSLKIMGINEDDILFERHEDPLQQVKDLADSKLRAWAFDKDAKDPFGKGKEKSKKFKTGAGTFYFFIKFLRHYLVSNGLSVPKQTSDSPLFQGVVGHGQYKELKAEDYQIEQMKQCLKDGFDTGLPKEIDSEDKDGKIVKFKPTKEDWHDAYFYFMLGMEIGFRAEEAFTIPVFMHPIEYLPQNVARYKAGTIGTKEEASTGYNLIRLFTRKTKHVKEPTHEGIVFDPMVNQMVKERQKQVADSKKTNSKAALDSLGIVKEYFRRKSLGKEIDKNPKSKTYGKEVERFKRVLTKNNVHSLIGRDGKYAAIGTITKEFPSTAGKYATNRKHLRDLMRHCYIHIRDPLPEDYFGDMPLHAIRHIFAQYWLDFSKWDYGFVARLGHWKTIAELENSYGYMPKKIFNAKWADIHQQSVAARLSKVKEGKLLAKALSDVEVAKSKTPLTHLLDEAYQNDAQIIADEKATEAELNADNNAPLPQDQQDELEITVDTFHSTPDDLENVEDKEKAEEK